MHEFLPFIVIGLTTGSVYGLGATGLVISYKTSGIFNFAFGAMAAMSVFVFYWLHDQNGVAWPLAAAICVLVLGPAMGLFLELLARRLQSVNHTMQIAATIGLILWIVGIGDVWFRHVSGSFPPFLPTSTVRVFGVNVQWQQIIVMIVSLAGAVGLYYFLQYARMGRAMRAVVDDPDLVAMIGQSPVVVRRSAWVISTTFAAIAGLLIAPSLSIDALVLTLLVVQAFGAAAIGYFSSLPLTYLGGLALGIAGALATKYTSDVSWLINLPSGLPFIVLIIVLVVLPRSKLTLRRFTVPISVPPSWQAPPRVRIGAGVIFIGLLCAVPSLVGFKLTVYTSALTLVILLLSLGLLVRTSRQVSLCQYAFAAIGAAAMGHFTSGLGIPWLPALLLAGLVAVPVGALVAIPAIRLSGVFLALATYGFGVLLEQVFYPQSYMFGTSGSGIAIPRPTLNLGAIHTDTDTGFYFVVVICAVLSALAVIVITESRMGRLLRAMGDSPLALESYGLSVNVTRVLVFCVSAYLAAISGALTGSLFHFALGTSFPSYSSLSLLALIVIVVAGDPWYAVIAAASLSLIPAYLTSSTVVDYLNAVFGVGAVATPAFRDKITGAPQVVRRLGDRLGGPRYRQAVTPALAAVGAGPAGAAVGAGPVGAAMASRAAVPAATTDAVHRPPVRSAAARNASGDEGLVVKELSVRYGGAIAVDDSSLSASLGTITGLIGPNGAGKTTIFNACSGIVKPTKGRISLLGDDVSDLSPAGRARRGLGRTFQRVQLFESLDVRTNIELARECTIAGANPYRNLIAGGRDQSTIAAATRSAVELVGIEGLLDTPVQDLSTGQRRYVELARVLAGPFDIVMLDEPSSGLDHNETQRLGEILVTVVRERGIGLLLVEHDMSLVRQVCSHIYVLDFGRMIFEGSPNEMAQSEIVKAAYLGTEGETEPVSTGQADTLPVEESPRP
jgi:ABC-type branched-subunit amino acid transport system ATPase component/branched-subunit amino acid ABC-type transport system permease component